MNSEQILKQYDEWLTDGSAVAALVMRQWLVPVEGKDTVIFPPTYAKPERAREEDWLGYNIDRLADGTRVCQIDSVGAQANRIEPIFKQKKYQRLVPQVIITAGERKIHLLDAGHRAADAIVRFSDLAPKLEEAFRAWKAKGNAEPLAKIAPTSIVFGSWDSRSTQAKIPRILRSVIRAFDVETLHRSAQYIPPIDYVTDGLLATPANKQEQDSMSELGLSHAPAPWTHGGILARGGIRRDGTLNLAALRALGTDSNEADDVLKLRRYILGLALVSFTAPQDTFLREGCQLVSDPDPERAAQWKLVKADGSRQDFPITHDEALAFATAAADVFVVGENRTAIFASNLARHALNQTKEERKATRRRGQSPTQPEQAAGEEQ